MRVFSSGALVLFLFVLVTVISSDYHEKQEPVLYEYVIRNYEKDCGTTNSVTAILLNYRMYDTMFEVLILLTAIMGMKHFLPTNNELKNGKSVKGKSVKGKSIEKQL